MNRKLKRSVAAIMIAMTAASVAVADSGDRTLFATSRHKSDYMPMVQAGSAPVDEALGRIIPAPYRVLVDDSIPSSLYLVWGSGDNWMDILRRAIAPIGLKATPDWSRNSIRIEWVDKPNTNKEVAVAEAADFVVVEQEKGVAATHPPSPHTPLPGDFVVVKQPDPAPSPTREPAPEPKQSEPLVLASFETSERTGKLPEANVMWRLMQAAVNGDKIVLSGVSSLTNEKMRVRYANDYANKLRASLLAVGFPLETVVVAEDAVSLGKRGGVKIKIVKGDAK